jgi:peroxiredoxin
MKVRRSIVVPRVLLAVQLLIALLPVVTGASQQPGDKPLEFALSDSAGKTHSPKEWQQSKAVVLIFIGADCPISNGYAPEINRITAAYASKQVSFYIVHSDPDMTREDAAKHAIEYGYRFTVLLDPTQILAKRFGVTITPTAVLLSNDGEARYRGRIDNRYIGLGQQRPEATQHDLRDAVEATLAGKKITEAITKPIGCFLPSAGK